MKIKSLQALTLALAAAFIPTSSVMAGLEEAKNSFTRRYQVSNQDRFMESPFNGYYIIENRDSQKIFNEHVIIQGFGFNWSMLDDIQKGSYKTLDDDGARAVRIILRKSLKTDWMVPLIINNKSSKSVTIISAPNCGYCRQLEKELEKHGSALGANVYIIPTILGPEPKRFTNAVLCNPDPLAIWKLGMLKPTDPPLTRNSCEKANWASLVENHSFEKKGSNLLTQTPAIIRPDGSIAYGWKINQNLDDIKKTLGI